MTVNVNHTMLNDLVVVEIIEQTGNVLLPEWQRKTLKGVVVARGPGQLLYNNEHAPMSVEIGDIVSFSPTAGMEADYGRQGATRIMRDTDIDLVWREV